MPYYPYTLNVNPLHLFTPSPFLTQLTRIPTYNTANAET